jgi:hypothetical protein
LKRRSASRDPERAPEVRASGDETQGSFGIDIARSERPVLRGESNELADAFGIEHLMRQVFVDLCERQLGASRFVVFGTRHVQP